MNNTPNPTAARLLAHMVKGGHKLTVHSNRFPRRGKHYVHAAAKMACVLSPAPRRGE